MRRTDRSAGRAFLQQLAFVLALLCFANAGAQTTDLISRGAVIPWKQDVASPDVISANFEEVRFSNAQGLKLRAWYFPCAEATQTILVCSGNTGNISLSLPYAKLLLDGGFNVLLFDYQGFGGSEGIASVMSLCTDTEAAFRYLTEQRNLKPENIGVFGISLGSILALMIANEQKAAAVAVEDVFVPEQMLERFGVREDDPNVMKGMAVRLAKQLLLGRVDPIQNAKSCDCPVFLMHGLNDRLLPFSGTVQVSNVLNPNSRVWLMDRAGHAPETLEVNDREYSAQLTQFFHSAMSNRFSSLETKFRSERLESKNTTGRNAKPSGFEVLVTFAETPTQHQLLRPIQLTFVNDKADFRVVRTMMAAGQARRWHLPFEPVHCSAIEFTYVSPGTLASENSIKDVDSNSIHEWQPELTQFSEHRAELVNWTVEFFQSPRVAQHLMTNYGKNFFRASRYVNSYPERGVQRLLDFLKKDANRPPEICARYARLLARLYCWPLPKQSSRKVQFSNDAQRVSVAETMLKLLPENRDEYFELGNASFQYRFRDAVVADALFRLARIRLRNGNQNAARQLLRLHVQLLPSNANTDLTEQRIASISTVTDLDGPDPFDHALRELLADPKQPNPAHPQRNKE
ncbi:MAG: alpha/beta fold hydrolase [Fuerstiella sp.]